MNESMRKGNQGEEFEHYRVLLFSIAYKKRFRWLFYACSRLPEKLTYLQKQLSSSSRRSRFES